MLHTFNEVYTGFHIQSVAKYMALQDAPLNSVYATKHTLYHAMQLWEHVLL